MNPQNIYQLTCVLPAPDEMALAKISQILAGLDGVFVQDITVLSPSKAIDITLEIADNRAAKTPITALSQSALPVDYCLQTGGDRRKTLLICDMDSTLIGQECIDELADFAGVKAKVVGITERAMQGEIDFDTALRERVALLKGLPLSALHECYDTRITLNPGARTLARTMAENGAQTVIVSGGFTVFSSRVAEAAGFAHNQANVLQDDGKTLDGTVQMPILGREAKLAALTQYAAPLGGNSHAIAIGDGANDLAMITAAGLGIAYRAKPIVAKAAHCAINHTDLTTALYFQGYKDEDLRID